MAVSQALAAQETGRIIDEHYSRDEYIRRRAGYLSKRPDYAHIPNHFPMVRGHADEIFTTEHEVLSVQEVRRREEAAEIEDMTPLPTTENTQTIDNFASYGKGNREWSPGVGWPAIPQTKTVTAMTQPAAITRPNVSSQQQTGTIVASATSRAMNSNHFIPDTRSTASSSPVDTMAPDQLAEVRQQASPSSSMVRVHSNVSALSGRGMSVPVKVKSNKNKPAATSPSSEANDSVLDDGAMKKQTMKQVPIVEAKQPRGKKRAAPSSSSPELDASSTNNGNQSTTNTPESTPSPAKKLKTLKGPRKPSPPAKKTPPKPKKAVPPRVRHIEAVIAGNALPKNAVEANAASATRHVRLLARHLARDDEADEDADLLPEFFNAETFDPEVDQIRCICMIVDDNEDGWLECEKCTVWQHASCMGVSFAAHEADENLVYKCHVCDPWEHRRKIAGLRKQNPLP